MQADILRRLLNLKSGIMEYIYQKWLSREDGFYDELMKYACEELEALSKMGNPDHREVEDGTGIDQAA